MESGSILHRELLKVRLALQSVLGSRGSRAELRKLQLVDQDDAARSSGKRSRERENEAGPLKG